MKTQNIYGLLLALTGLMSLLCANSRFIFMLISGSWLVTVASGLLIYIHFLVLHDQDIADLCFCPFNVKTKTKKPVDVELLILLKYSFYFDSMTNLRLSRQSEGMVSAGRHPHHLLVVQTLDAERLQSAKTHNTLLVRGQPFISELMTCYVNTDVSLLSRQQQTKNVQPKNFVSEDNWYFWDRYLVIKQLDISADIFC